MISVRGLAFSIREFFLNNLGLKAISLLLAFLIWFQVSGQLAVQRTLSLPIEFVNMPAELEIANEYPRNVDVFVRLERTRRTLDEGTMAMVVNLSGVTAGLEIVPLTDQNIRNRPSGLSVVSIMPPTLRLELERTFRKLVEVTPNIVGEPQEGYQISQYTVSPSEVMIAGPESRVRSVSAVQTEPINVHGLSSTLTRNVYLDVRDPRLRIESVASVSVTVRIEEDRRQVQLNGAP